MKAAVATLAVAVLAIAAGVAEASTLAVAGGGWSWFGDPRALVVGDNLFLGWITSKGNVEVGRLNMQTGGWAQARLRGPINIDVHSNPSLTTLRDGRLVAFYSPHSGRLTSSSRMWYRVGTRPGGVVGWGRERSVPVNTRGPLGYTYPNPLWIGRNLYLFWRGADWQPTFSRTSDLKSWAPARTLLRGMTGQRPYIKFDSFGDGIRFAYTASHPALRNTSLYYGELKGNSVRRANGSSIVARSRLPFRYSRGQLVYSWKTAGRAWLWDIAHDASGHPVLVYATLQGPQQHTYRYARWTGTQWFDRALTRAGPSIDHDPSYSAGVTLDHTNPDIVYLSRFSAAGRFELERWETHDQGHTFDTTPVTIDSTRDNLRPFVPRGASGDRVLLWTWGSYSTFTDFSDLVVMLRTTLPAPAQSRWHLHRNPPAATPSLT
jgi:hypothetical protein